MYQTNKQFSAALFLLNLFMKQIATKELRHIHQLIQSGHASNDGLLNGNLGLSYYYYNLYKATEKDEYRGMGESLLAAVFEKLNNGDPQIIGSSFGNGGAGLGFIVNELAGNRLLDTDMEKEFAKLDTFLFSAALTQIENDYIDCLHGAFGIIHYFAEREVTSKANEYLNELVEKICNRAVKQPQGYWFRNYVMQLEEKEEINFSLSHGLSGMLLILLKAYPKSSHKEVIEKTVRQGIRFMLKHKLYIDFSDDEYSFFPFLVKVNATEIENKPRMAWCYGDLGQVLLFYRTANLFGDKEILQQADLIGLHSLMRKDEAATRVSDSHFCHGSSGLAQFYKTLYKESGNTKYLEGYEHWIEQTILYLQKDLETGLYKGKEYDFLDGLVGVAFTLLSYISTKELNWSRVLFL